MPIDFAQILVIRANICCGRSHLITPLFPHPITGNEGCRCDRPCLSLNNLPTYKALQKSVTFSHRQGDRASLFFQL
ncbi:MAG: hypothetical protein HC941_15570 [Microcoleus sp. SU_5_3]|nr:hypothetical protein [Microcoleus sp. SU_5_3]